MKKTFWQKVGVVFAAILCLLVLPSGSEAAKNLMVDASRHEYAVIFKDNGEAVTFAKLSVANTGSTPLFEYTVEMPAVKVDALHFYQIVLPPFDASSIWDYSTVTYEGVFKAKELQYARKGNSYQLSLLVPVAPDSATAIIVNYSTKDFVGEKFGVREYEYTTIKVPEKISIVSVSSQTDKGLIMEGPEFLIENFTYNENMRAVAGRPGLGITDQDSFGVLLELSHLTFNVSEARGVAANTTFVVKGKYAANWPIMYVPQLTAALLGLIAVLTVLVKLIFMARKKRSENIAIGALDENLGSIFKALYILPGFLSALLLAAFAQFMGRLFALQSFQHLYNMHDAFHLFMQAGMVMTIILLVVIPVGLVGLAKGWRSFTMTLIFQAPWCVVVSVAYLLAVHINRLTPYWNGIFNS